MDGRTITKNYYRNIIKNLRKIVKCGICGHQVRLEFHHIKPTKLNGEGRGSAHRYMDIVKHSDCYIPLCYFCHQKVTSGEYLLWKTERSILFTNVPPSINVVFLAHVI